MTRTFDVLPSWRIPTWCGRNLLQRCESSQAEEADREALLRDPDTSADSSHTTRPFTARFWTSLPVVSTDEQNRADIAKDRAGNCHNGSFRSV
jgi:hypothetical protein